MVYVCVMMDQWERWRQGPEETMAADSGLLGFLTRLPNPQYTNVLEMLKHQLILSTYFAFCSSTYQFL